MFFPFFLIRLSKCCTNERTFSHKPIFPQKRRIILTCIINLSLNTPKIGNVLKVQDKTKQKLKILALNK